MKLRPFFWAFLALVIIPVTALALQMQRSQIGITILINVTPNPLGYHNGPAAGDTIIARAHLRGAAPAIEHEFEAEQLHFAQFAGNVVAQTSAQKSLKVEAEITPNPNATLLTSDAPGYTVTLNAEAGVTATFPCVYHVKVQTAITTWQLKHGLSADFTNGTTSWSGADVANNSYISTPQPTATPFAVFADNGGVWAILGNNTGTQQYCVDLTLNIPISTAQGTYSSNAIYTLFY